MAATKFTRRAEPSGWLTVKLSSSYRPIALCEYTKVELTRQQGGLTYFNVADGNSDFVGQEAYLHDNNVALYLSDTGPRGAASVTVRYVGEPAWETSPFKGRLLQQWADETFNGITARVTLNSIWDRDFTPIPPGTHAILAPDRSHRNISTAGYVSAAAGMHGNDVWFPIGLNGAATPSGRYIHVGHLSEGCITQHDLTQWSAIYDYLISSREPGSLGKRVGRVVVKK